MCLPFKKPLSQRELPHGVQLIRRLMAHFCNFVFLRQNGVFFDGPQKRCLLLISAFLIKSFLSLVSLAHFLQQIQQSYLGLLNSSEALQKLVKQHSYIPSSHLTKLYAIFSFTRQIW